MLCFIYKWNISRTLDTRKPLSRRTKRHLAGCESCREFSRLGEEMDRRLADDAASLLGDVKSELGEKVRRAIGETGTASAPRLSRTGLRHLKPVLGTAAALAIIGAGFFWLVRTRPSGMPPLEPLLKLEGQRSNLVSVIVKAESPYQEEIEGLKRAFLSTADFLAARFQVGLGENN
jgi:hypothetical protein